MIPRRFFRSVPATIDEQVEAWWRGFQDLHPGWEFLTYRDPIDPVEFPITSPLWHHCSSGAQMAGLLRLELLYTVAGFWIDSDVECYRSFEPLCGLQGVAGWEDERVVPDAVLGCEAGHPAVEECLSLAMGAVAGGRGAWESGPGVTTRVLPGRTDWLLLPPGSLYPRHYLERAHLDDPAPPWSFCQHRWSGSWLSPAQRAQLDRRQRP